MKKSTWFVLMFVAVLGQGCHDKREKPAVEKSFEIKQEVTETTVRDTVLAGVLGEETGMSSLQLITDEGDTLSVTKTSFDGIEGKILGEIRNYTDRVMLMAKVKGKDEFGLLTFLNVSQLEGKWKSESQSLFLSADSTVQESSLRYTHWRIDRCRLLLIGENTTEYGVTQSVDTAYFDYFDADSLHITIPRHGKIKFGK